MMNKENHKNTTLIKEDDNKGMDTTSATPTTHTTHKCANLIETEYDNNKIQQQQQQPQPQPCNGTEARTPIPQQDNEATHKIKHPALGIYATNTEHNLSITYTAKDLQITKMNNQTETNTTQ